ncbi:hypothetical protein vseg_013441 [Gypsophila vaccaria]
MKGYSKIKENNPFSQKLKSNKNSNNNNDSNNNNNNFEEISPTKKTQQNSQNDLLSEKNEVLFDGEEIKKGAILRRNYTISSSSNGKNNYCSNLERQGSKRVIIQEAVKRVFSMRRSSSVNNSSSSDKYSRIFDQPKNVEDDYYCDNINNDYGNDDGFNKVKKGEYLEGKSNNNGKLHVGCSKVVKACKRIFSR